MGSASHENETAARDVAGIDYVYDPVYLAVVFVVLAIMLFGVAKILKILMGYVDHTTIVQDPRTIQTRSTVMPDESTIIIVCSSSKIEKCEKYTGPGLARRRTIRGRGTLLALGRCLREVNL